MEKKHLKAFLLAGILLVICLVLIVNASKKEINEKKLNFSKETINKLNNLYKNVDKNEEFVGYLYVKNNTVYGLDIFGKKNEKTNEMDIIDYGVKESNYTIHNHNNGICYPSEQDLMGQEKYLCIMCDLNEIRCFENE